MGRQGGTIAIAVGAAFVLLCGPADANRFVVTTAADHKPGKCTKKDCTLREAVIRANEHDGVDKVRLAAALGPYELKRAGADEDEGSKGDLDINDGAIDITATGGRATIRQTVSDRVLHVLPDLSSVSLNRLTLTGGEAVPAGGGLFAEDQTFFSDGTIRNNEAEDGGGVAAVGPDARFGVTQSTIKDNRGTDSGGGLHLVGNDGVTSGISSSTLTGNRAPLGGAVYALHGDGGLTFNNSTITGNRAGPGMDATAGGIYLALTSGAGITRIGHTTIAANEAPAGDGHAANLQVLSHADMENTLIADPLGGAPSCTFDVDSVGHNLDDGTTCGLDQGTDLEDANAGLKPLADNGGPTQTLALKASSDAIEGGTCPGTIVQFGVDQRGAGRPAEIQGLSCDIGAFEHDPTSPHD